jgi:lipoprotein-anchoring transpeptidase ErfK/SrfK
MPRQPRNNERGVLALILKILPAVLALFLAGCGTTSELNPFFPNGTQGSLSNQEEDNISYWDDGEGIHGRPSIKIDLEGQRAYFYKGQRMVGVSVISTGREGHDTPPGKFHVVDKDVAHASSLYGDYVDSSGQVVVENVENKKDPPPPGAVFRGAPMPYFLRIHGDIGMHAGYLPGYPASHGCIRLPEVMAVKFFDHAPVGTPVEIR